MSRSERTLMRLGRSAAVLAGSADLPATRPEIERDRVVATLGEQAVDLALQVLEVVEALVHAREADVGDLVQLAELLHRQRTDPRRRHLARTLGPELRLDRVGRLLGGVVGDRPAGQGLPEARGELLAVELLAVAVALHDDQAGGLDPLIGREPGRAGAALAAAADRR